MDAAVVSDLDIDGIDAADREWWEGWRNYLDGAGFDVARFEAENDFLTCGCHGRDWTCGHYGWHAAIVRPAAS